MEEETMETTFLTQNMSTTTVATTNATTQEVQKSLHALRRNRRRRTEAYREVAVEDEEKEDEDEGSDDREEIEKKINALQRIVPNGESYGVEELFDETAGYILSLQYQVKALKALTGFFQKMEKDKTKLGG